MDVEAKELFERQKKTIMLQSEKIKELKEANDALNDRLVKLATMTFRMNMENEMLKFNIVQAKEFINQILPKDVNVVKVIYDDPVTKVYFSDGSKTIVKTMEGETFDKTAGYVLAVLKKVLGNAEYYKVIRFISSSKTADKVIDVKAARKAKAKKTAATKTTTAAKKPAKTAATAAKKTTSAKKTK